MTEVRNGAADVLELCARIAACSDVPGSITRTYLSAATRTVHDIVCTEMQALGMEVRVDCAGNVRGVYAGEDVWAARFVLGSHLDTVPDAGAYDGVLGVAVALEVVRGLVRARRRLPFALEVIAFSEEEGVRFRLPFIGSRAAVGALTPGDLRREDSDGISLERAVLDFGLQPRGLLQGNSDALLCSDAIGFLEVHIEQGPVLEAAGVALGIVGTVVGQSRYALRFTGQANHAGTTPMHLRHDALAAAAAWVAEVERYAAATPGLVATVGQLQVQPGAANVIAGICTATLDLRHSSDAVRQSAAAQLQQLAAREAERRGVQMLACETSCQGSVAMDGALQHALTQAAAAVGAASLAMHSGAGHDAMIMAARVPVAMLFVRSPGGISHHPSESVSVDDVQVALATCSYFVEHLQPVLPGATP